MAEKSMRLVDELQARPASEAAQLLLSIPAKDAFDGLAHLNTAFALDILGKLPPEARQQITACASPEIAGQWQRNQMFDTGKLGRLMELAGRNRW